MNNPPPDWTHHRPWRNANPGDLRPRHSNPWPGQVAIDNGPGGPFAIFASHPDGWAALFLWITEAPYRGLHSARAMIDVFAPPVENATASYAAGVAAKLGVDVDAAVNTADPAVREALAKAIAHWEDWQAAWPQAQIDAGMTLADARWAAFAQAAGWHVAPSATNVETDAKPTGEA